MTSEDFRDRLRRLRREPPAADATAPSDDGSIPGALTRRENRTLARRDNRRGALARRHEPAAGERSEPSELDDALELPRGIPDGLERVERPRSPAGSAGIGGVLLARREVVAREHRHGALRLEDVSTADPRAFAVLTRDAALGEIDLRRAIYLDTETSGLSGGSGTYVFMVGLGTFEGDGFHVWQGFLDDPAQEWSLLDETAARVRAAPAIVSFFGKSFDRHRLEDRMRCLGIDPPFAGKPHLDLFHPLRRAYRGTFPDHRLRTLESALCGLARDDDLPGSQAPAAWFDYLAGRPHRLEGVFRHNRDDVLSLVTLAAHLGSVLRADGGAAALEDARAANVSRALARAGDLGAALALCDEALARGGVGGGVGNRGARDLRILRAELHRQQGARAAALEVLRELAAEPEDEHTGAVLLSMARLEWRELGDLSAARSTCTRAASVASRRHTGTELARLERDIASLLGILERRAISSARKPKTRA